MTANFYIYNDYLLRHTNGKKTLYDQSTISSNTFTYITGCPLENKECIQEGTRNRKRQ